jgi:hypothetical protein
MEIGNVFFFCNEKFDRCLKLHESQKCLNNGPKDERSEVKSRHRNIFFLFSFFRMSFSKSSLI